MVEMESAASVKPRDLPDPSGQIDALIAERRAARAAKDFARADEIRRQLEADGIVLEDNAGGTIWRRKN